MSSIQTNGHDEHNQGGPRIAAVDDAITALEATGVSEDILQRAAQAAGAIAFVHFDPSSATSNIVEALIHYDDLTRIHRGLYVHILSIRDNNTCAN